MKKIQKMSLYTNHAIIIYFAYNKNIAFIIVVTVIIVLKNVADIIMVSCMSNVHLNSYHFPVFIFISPSFDLALPECNTLTMKVELIMSIKINNVTHV